MKRLSTKRAKQNYEYKKIRIQFLLDHPLCEVCEKQESSEIHHKKGRIGELLTNTNHFLSVCRNCHRWIEEHPKMAKAFGYSESRLATI